MIIKKIPFTLKKFIVIACRLALAVIFLYAAVEKIIDPREFAVAIYNYDLLPDIAVNMLAVILPMLEIFLAVSLISGIYVRGASLTASFLFLAFAIALSASLLRGLDISCGCFGKSSENINWLYLIRDLSLFLMSIFVFLVDEDRNYFPAKLFVRQ